MLRKYILLLPILFVTACLEEPSDKLDQMAFTKIYDNSEFQSSFYAIDMKQTSDGGYLILGGKTKIVDDDNVNSPLGVYLLKADQYGNFVNEMELDETYVYPVGNLNLIGDSYYFICMDAATNAYLVNIDELAEIAIISELSYNGEPITLPLASSKDNSNELLLLSYDNTNHESVFSKIATNASIGTEPKRFFTGTDSPIDNLVIKHANKEGTQFPFSIGQTSTGLYFFNGFINYTFSLVFTDLNEDDEYQGIVNGQQENAGMSMVLPITGSTFAVSTFSFGFNFLLPNAMLDVSSTSSVTDVQQNGYSFPELENNARVKAIRAVINGKNVVIYGSNTKSKQIGLYFYDEATGEFLDSEYVGYSNPFEIAAIVQTTEGDLVVSGTTYVAGRLPRFCLIKIPKSSLKGI